MIESYQNKSIGKSPRTKSAKAGKRSAVGSAVKTGMKSYSFPSVGRTVKAGSLAEATKIINKESKE